jgi:IS5 family transposase
MAVEAVRNMSARFDTMCAKTGRPSISLEKLLRAQLIQTLYSVRSERLLMEEIDYGMLFRWFVGMNLDEPVWDVTVFTKNRNRLLEDDVAREFLCEVIAQADAKGLTSDETEVFHANGTVECYAALIMMEQIPGTRRVTVGADKGYDTNNFVAECRHLNVTPHVAQNVTRNGGSAIDLRTTRYDGYAISQRKRKRIEECFGWLKTIALMRKVRHRGIEKVG